MESKKNYFVRNMLCLILIAVLVSCVALCSVGTIASAATSNQPQDEAAPFGLMTKISLDIGSTGTTMWARAHNDFTLGISTIQVYVYLFSSQTYQEDYLQMTLESVNYIGDLNINQTLETTAPINGVQRYWRARVKYKLDQKDWVSMESETHLVDVNGNVIR